MRERIDGIRSDYAEGTKLRVVIDYDAEAQFYPAVCPELPSSVSMGATKVEASLYCQTIEQFEDETFADRFWSAGIMWARNIVAPVLLTGLSVAGSAGSPFLVRHQLRVHRDTVHEVRGAMEQYKTRGNFDLTLRGQNVGYQSGDWRLGFLEDRFQHRDRAVYVLLGKNVGR